MPRGLTDVQDRVLRDIVELHEDHGGVVILRTMPADEREAVRELVFRGLLEVRARTKNSPEDRRIVVPTPNGRRLVAHLSPFKREAA